MESYPATLPLAFLLAGEKDSAQMSVGLPTLYLDLALKQAGVPVELHVLTWPEPWLWHPRDQSAASGDLVDAIGAAKE